MAKTLLGKIGGLIWKGAKAYITSWKYLPDLMPKNPLLDSLKGNGEIFSGMNPSSESYSREQENPRHYS